MRVWLFYGFPFPVGKGKPFPVRKGNLKLPVMKSIKDKLALS